MVYWWTCYMRWSKNRLTWTKHNNSTNQEGIQSGRNIYDILLKFVHQYVKICIASIFWKNQFHDFDDLIDELKRSDDINNNHLQTNKDVTTIIWCQMCVQKEVADINKNELKPVKKYLKHLRKYTDNYVGK